MQYFSTIEATTAEPIPSWAQSLCDRAGVASGNCVLVVSDVRGFLARSAAMLGAAVTVVDGSGKDPAALEDAGFAVLEGDFRSARPSIAGQFDVVLAGPEFASSMDIECAAQLVSLASVGGIATFVAGRDAAAPGPGSDGVFARFLEDTDATVSDVAAEFRAAGYSSDLVLIVVRRLDAPALRKAGGPG